VSGWGLVPGRAQRHGAGTPNTGAPVPATLVPPSPPRVTWRGKPYACPLCGVEVRRARLDGGRTVLLTTDGERHPVICDRS